MLGYIYVCAFIERQWQSETENIFHVSFSGNVLINIMTHTICMMSQLWLIFITHWQNQCDVVEAVTLVSPSLSLSLSLCFFRFCATTLHLENHLCVIFNGREMRYTCTNATLSDDVYFHILLPLECNILAGRYLNWKLCNTTRQFCTSASMRCARKSCETPISLSQQNFDSISWYIT